MADWPVTLQGITESIVATPGPSDQWNIAALGLFAGDPVTARTWGDTRTRRGFTHHNRGFIQFTRDPVDFVEAALAVCSQPSPILDDVDAWVEATVTKIETGESRGTTWAEWSVTPVNSTINRRRIWTINRGYNAVIEATIAASRLDVRAFETTELISRLDYLATVVHRCGSDRDRVALARIDELTSGWNPERS